MVGRAENVLKLPEKQFKIVRKAVKRQAWYGFSSHLFNRSSNVSPHALKGQKLLAQGSALGIIAIGKAPCKGKSFLNCLIFESFCPYRATGLRS